MSRSTAWSASWFALVLLATASPALAYDSRCYMPDAGACAEGPQAARGRWVGESDEHRQLFVAGMQSAGLPLSLNDTLELTVFTNGSTVAGSSGTMPTLIPSSLGDVGALQSRQLTVAEFAQLPDFGYSLSDWALGLETCPVDSVDATSCHLFAGHMGALNSNHFLPQSQVFYGHYHALALARAGECKATSTKLGAEAARFADVVRECEKEALLLEAVAQHYLQDAWSSGHMWSRWGSPDRAAFPSLLRGVAVAATAGLIHGSRALLQPDLSELLISVPDAMCAPQPEVEWSHPEQGRHAGVGDLYLGELRTDARFVRQHTMLTSCAVAGMRTVYVATAQAHGPLLEPTEPGLVSVDPTSDACFGQRATNRAIHRGFGIDVTLVGGPRHIAITPALGGSVLLAGASAVDANESAIVGSQFAFDLILLSATLEFHAKTDPFGTNMASGGIGSLVGIEPNGAYITSPPAPYVDPALPWAPSPRTATTAPVAALARTFHRGHAAEWCAAFIDDAAALDVMRDRVTTLDGAIAAEAPGSPTHQGLVAARAAQCAMCGEFTGRHLRLGTGPTSYQTAREPLCTLLNPASPVVYGEGATLSEAALRRCGCIKDVVVISPTRVLLQPGQTQQFVATPSAGVQWSLTGINGTIDQQGLFTAGPDVDDVLVIARVGNATASAEAFVAPWGVFASNGGGTFNTSTAFDTLDGGALTGLPQGNRLNWRVDSSTAPSTSTFTISRDLYSGPPELPAFALTVPVTQVFSNSGGVELTWDAQTGPAIPGFDSIAFKIFTNGQGRLLLRGTSLPPALCLFPICNTTEVRTTVQSWQATLSPVP